MSEDGPEDISMALWPEVKAIVGAQETLAALVPIHRIAVATNATVSKRKMIEVALERVSLLRYVSEIFCFTEIGFRKDSPEFWDKVLSTLRVDAGDVAMVGDSLEHDVIAPRRCGIFSVWFNENHRQNADAHGLPTIQKLSDVIPLVTR